MAQWKDQIVGKMRAGEVPLGNAAMMIIPRIHSRHTPHFSSTTIDYDASTMVVPPYAILLAVRVRFWQSRGLKMRQFLRFEVNAIWARNVLDGLEHFVQTPMDG